MMPYKPKENIMNTKQTDTVLKGLRMALEMYQLAYNGDNVHRGQIKWLKGEIAKLTQTKENKAAEIRMAHHADTY